MYEEDSGGPVQVSSTVYDLDTSLVKVDSTSPPTELGPADTETLDLTLVELFTLEASDFVSLTVLPLGQK